MYTRGGCRPHEGFEMYMYTMGGSRHYKKEGCLDINLLLLFVNFTHKNDKFSIKKEKSILKILQNSYYLFFIHVFFKEISFDVVICMKKVEKCYRSNTKCIEVLLIYLQETSTFYAFPVNSQLNCIYLFNCILCQKLKQ